MLSPFKNEPFTNFADPANKAAFEQALALVESRFGEKIPLIVGGERIFTDDTIKSTNPANPEQVLAYVGKGTQELALKAVESANETFQTWKLVDPDARARILIRAAAILRRRKHEFSATMVMEIGKNWMEADGDTAEAIDFLEFYGREMMRLNERQPVVDYPGEENNLLLHSPRRRRRHSAVELPVRHHGRHDHRLPCHRQHRLAEARVDHPRDRLPFHGNPRRSRPPRGCRQLPARPRRRHRRHHRRSPAHPLHRLHRFDGNRPAHLPARLRGASRPALAEAHGARNGRQGRYPRRRRRRSRNSPPSRSSPPPSASRVRSAAPARVLSCTTTSTTNSSPLSSSARRRSRPARRRILPTGTVPSAKRALTKRFSTTSRSARRKAAASLAATRPDPPAGSSNRRSSPTSLPPPASCRKKSLARSSPSAR